MRILGVNKGSTSCGKALRNGGAAAYIDGRTVAIAEERVTGHKYAGGYTNSLDVLLRSQSLEIDDFDEIGVSTCCETEKMAEQDHELATDPRVRSVNHHLSHAALAFYPSGFDRALVVVIDGGGNVLAEDACTTEADKWWTFPREQHTYYMATRKHGLELVDRDFTAPYEVGLGEMYRAFTYYLGWHSSTHSSRTMALAGHGRRGAIKGDLFNIHNNRLTGHVKNCPPDPVGMVAELAYTLDVDFGEPRRPGDAILQVHKDVAAFVQDQTERALTRRIADLKRKLAVDQLCMAGGLALNVVANGRLFELFPHGMYVPSAPGDDGQCLGNVYALLAKRKDIVSSMPSITNSADTFLGPPNRVNSKAVATALADCNVKNYIVFETSDHSDLLARMLAGGDVVCLYQDRSEFGPRALGARSLLADPRRADTVSRLNTLKGREWFMPFAPAVLADDMQDWFESTVASPFMSFAVKATSRALNEIPAIVNADGTARVQTVTADVNAPLWKILTQFAKRTSIPVLLNTSFNLGGKPIVESADQAVRAFKEMPVNVLGLGRFVILKSLSPDLPVSSAIKGLTIEVYTSRAETPTSVPASRPRTTIRRLQALTDSVVFVRTELPLYGKYLEWLRKGRKVTTIRFRKGAVEVPFASELPLYETADFSPGDRTRPTEHVSIAALRYHRFGELTEADASRDGFESFDDMRNALTEIYPGLSDGDWVTVYDISLVPSNTAASLRH